MRTFGSPKTPRTTGSGRNPSNEYVSQSRRRRFDRLTVHNLCQILNPAKMQNIPEIPRPVPLQALKSTHSIPRRPAFFKQAVLQGEIGRHLLQGGGFTTKVLHFTGRRGARGVARQPALAGLQELLRPAVIHRGGNAFPAAQLRDVLLAAQSFQHNADLLFGRILLPRRPADVADKLLGRTSGGNGFLSHLRSLAATMSQKSSVPQAAKFVSQALKRDSRAATSGLPRSADHFRT